MDYKSYKKEFDYSYALGAFPTIELIKNKKEYVLDIVIDPSFNNQEVINYINKEIDPNHIHYSTKMINKLSTKENVYVIGIFKKYNMSLKKGNHILLDDPSDMGNMGTIMRTSLGFNISNIGIIKPGLDIFNPKVIRSSMGAIFSLNIEYFDSFDDYKKISKNRCYSLMLQAKNKLADVRFENVGTTFIFGNEARGLDDSYLNEDSIIIEHSNKIDSLNLPISLSITLYEFNKQIK